MPALVQHTTNTGSFSTGTSGTVNVTISAAGAGNCLVACISGAGSNGTPSVTSVKTGAAAENWVLGVEQDDGSNTACAAIWVDPNTGGGGTTVAVTVAFGATASASNTCGVFVDVFEFSGMATSSVVDKTSVGATGQNSASWSAGTTGTTTQASEVAVGTVGATPLSGTSTVTGPGGSWVNEATLSGTVILGGTTYNTYAQSGYQILSSTGTVTYNGTTSASTLWNTVVLTLKAAVSSPTITTMSLPGGTVGTPYSQTVSATGGTLPYTWSISAGSLPSPLAINSSTGVISGTPTTPGTSSFTVKCTDASSNTATQPLSIIISAAASGTPTIVQQVTGSVTGSYGIGTTAISSSPGNGLVAFIGWNCVTSGGNVAVPSACVSDSAGNLWKQIGITQNGTAVTAYTRCAIWATINAEPVSWVSIGIAGFSATAAWTIVEISGLAQAISVDYSVGVNNFYTPPGFGGTQPTLTGVASQADIGFALFDSGCTGQTFSGPGGWTALNVSTATYSIGFNPAQSGTTIYPYWNTGVTAGSVTTAGTFGTSTSYSVVQCGIANSASPPAQPSPDFPLVVTEAAFGATPGIISSSLDYTFSSEYVTWTDISTRVVGDAVSGRISATRGREYELQQEEAGNMSAYLSNYDGAFTPTNPGSPYYSNALNSNMSFQSGVAGWHGLNGAAISSSTAQTYASGLNAIAYYSMLVTPNGSSSQPTVQTTLPVPVNQNYPYSFSCWMDCPAGYATGAYMSAWWLDSGGGTIKSVVGGTIPLPAGVWTQLPAIAETPPSGAASVLFGPVIQGTPTATPFYVAEAAAVTGPAAVATGLVALETPVRVTCWWNGRQFPIWMGYAERWPQGWPDMPQWGFSQITATDALAVAAANSMQSALIGEVLIDNPYAYLPCNEQYTTQVIGATPTDLFFYSGSPQLVPVDANGQIALNRATGNQTTGVYLDGNSQQVSTGLAINFLGDDGTVMGAAGYQNEVTGQVGPSMQYIDPGLPAIASSAVGFTIEFWVSVSTSGLLSFFSSYGPPSAFNVTALANNGLSINIDYRSTSLVLFVNGVSILSYSTVLSLNTPHHIVYVFPPTEENQPVFLYLDGALVLFTPATLNVAMNAVILGPGRYSYDCNIAGNDAYAANNYAAGHLAIYNYQLTAGRILAHYEAGAAGWSGVSAAQRFAQVLDWAQLGLKRGGYLQSSAIGAAEITQIGPAYQLSGSSASDAVNAVAQSEGGQYYVKADGTITYVERPAGYNLAVQATLGDNATAANNFLNPNTSFAFGISGWTGIGGAVSASVTETYGSPGSLLLAPTGSSGTAVAQAAAARVTPGASYTAAAWVWSQAGYASVITGFSQLSAGGATVSTSLASVPVPAQSWTYLSTAVTCPASGVSQFRLLAGESGTPGTASTLYIGFAGMWQNSTEVPYMKETEFGFDNSQLYNEVTATQQSGPNALTVYDDRNLPSEQAYFRRSALSVNANVVSPYDVSDITTWSIATFSQPSVHVSAVKVHASGNPLVAFPVVLNIDVGDIVQVNRRPLGGAAIMELGIVEKITYEIGPRYFYVTYQISPYAPSNNVLCADTQGLDNPSANATLILGW